MSLKCTKEYTITVGGTTAYAYFKLDEPSGSAYVDSVAGFDVVPGTGVISSTAGKIGNAWDIGSGLNFQWVNGPNTHWNFTDAFTVRLWLRIAATPGNYILLNSHSGPWQFEYFGSGSEVVEFLVETTGGSIFVDSDPLSLGVWHHIVCWNNPGVGCGMRIDDTTSYAMAGVDPVTVYATSTLELTGSHFLRSGFAMDEIGFWKRVLTPAEITADYNGGVGKTWPNVV